MPVGTRGFNIVNTQEFFVGQSIIVFRPDIDAWIKKPTAGELVVPDDVPEMKF